MSVSAAGALLWMTHTLLREHQWAPQDITNRLEVPESFAGDVNLLPAQRYKVSKTGEETVEIHVRALLVGNNLFVHFVAANKSVPLRLQVAEFVKPREQTEHQDKAQGRVLYTEGWRCNLEILQWRLERNLFPEFSSESSLVASGAELSRLPEPLLVRVGGFLSLWDLCQLTGTCKYLHQLQDASELWQKFLRRDFPTLSPGDSQPKAVYRAHWFRQKRMNAWSQRLHEHQLREIRQQAPWRWRGGGRLPIYPPHPLHLPIPPPFQPFGEGAWPPRPPLHPGVLGDDDLDMFRDPFHLNFPHFY